ncbi:hypothetical protein [Blastopirellula marina]|uniref:Uncharacterized protein n=1 Tax=Blastopirellula marina TaxID=124 RepID=A0A2S8GF87_9BACT|nr:hypothetical protein [Blastopirellula marina]PQO43126.1 hypothetical protein C5Y93_25800 [Blastopirellula marina]
MRQTFWKWTILSLTAATVGCQAMHTPHNLPPAQQLRHPGPGVDGPGPGVLAPPPIQTVSAMMPMDPNMGIGAPGAMSTSQILFVKPDGMQVQWDVGGIGYYDSTPRVVPFPVNFPQGGIYRLKLTNIPGNPGAELYPTIEVGPATPRTDAFLAHNAIPVQFTEEDFAQVRSGNFVTKVIYLPDPNYQELALADVETLVSTRLDPGVDPIREADCRGTIMAIIRLGNKDLEMPEDGLQAGGPGFDPNVMAGMGGMPGPMGYPGLPGGPPYSVPYVAGVTTPEYGMPYVGTPIGLPGPAHIPLGGPAGLQKHVMTNHTHMHIPGPTDKVNIHVKQKPGLSYPTPPNKAWIVEENVTHAPAFGQPHADRREYMPSPDAGGYCPPQ